jgi:hypothetical protein
MAWKISAEKKREPDSMLLFVFSRNQKLLLGVDDALTLTEVQKRGPFRAHAFLRYNLETSKTIEDDIA